MMVKDYPRLFKSNLDELLGGNFRLADTLNRVGIDENFLDKTFEELRLMAARLGYSVEISSSARADSEIIILEDAKAYKDNNSINYNIMLRSPNGEVLLVEDYGFEIKVQHVVDFKRLDESRVEDIYIIDRIKAIEDNRDVKYSGKWEIGIYANNLLNWTDPNLESLLLDARKITISDGNKEIIIRDGIENATENQVEDINDLWDKLEELDKESYLGMATEYLRSILRD